jgi:succinate dehydrogenase hydrophobic anchor subunit
MLYYPIVTQQGADVTLPRKPHTCNNIFVKLFGTFILHISRIHNWQSVGHIWCETTCITRPMELFVNLLVVTISSFSLLQRTKKL